MMKLSGDVIKYDRDNINTDEIMNNEYLAKYDMDAEQLGKYCLIHYDPTFVERVKLAEETSDGDRLTIDLQEKRIRNETQKRDYAVPVYPYFIWEIIEHGGIIGWMQKSGGGFHEKYV